MSHEVVVATAKRIREYACAHSLKYFSLVLHGGEPLLLGHDRLDEYLNILSVELASVPHISFGLQTNGTLLDNNYIEIAKKYRLRFGLSIDGPPHIQDRYRVDHRGEGSGAVVERALRLLMSEPQVFSGALCVVDLHNDPLEVYRYLAQPGVPSLDFLLPDANHNCLPPGVVTATDSTQYADWLEPIFQEWYEAPQRPNIKLFSSIMRLLLGFPGTVDSVGGGPSGYAIVESNGDIEGLDSLKSCYEGATITGLSVLNHSLDDAAVAAVLKAGTVGLRGLCDECQSCGYKEVCGGGYLVNRYESTRGFLNPSVYCHGLMKLISIIAKRMLADFNTASIVPPLGVVKVLGLNTLK